MNISKRYDTCFQVKVECSGRVGECIFSNLGYFGRTVNISQSGLRVRMGSSLHWKIGEEVMLYLFVPGISGIVSTPLQLKKEGESEPTEGHEKLDQACVEICAEIVWKKGSDFGLKIHWLTQKSLLLYNHFLRMVEAECTIKQQAHTLVSLAA